jgi:hypothetical protein
MHYTTLIPPIGMGGANYAPPTPRASGAIWLLFLLKFATTLSVFCERPSGYFTESILF